MSNQASIHGEPFGSRFELQRVVLIDSYTEGRITELPLAGGTAITGRNGRGKTTLLRLIPAFYGALPNRIVKPASNRKNFVPYYLPRSTSYIVYEYRRDDVLCCAVLCSDQSGDGVEYRFVRSAYQREWFVHDDERTLVASQNLPERLKLRNVPCTGKMRLDQYRAVIQGKRTHGSDLKLHRRYVQEYACCPQGQSLQHIESIVLGMFMRKTNFTDLQRMIVSSVEGAREDARGQIALGAERKKIEAWPGAFESYSAVMAEEHRMEPVQKAYDALFAAEQELRSIHARFLSFDRALAVEEARKSHDCDAAEHDLKRVEQEHGDAKLELREKIDSVNRTIGETERELKQLSETRGDFLDMEVESKAALQEREQEIEHSKQILDARRAAMLSQQKDIADQYEKLQNQMKLEHALRMPEFDRQRVDAQERRRQHDEALTVEFEQTEHKVRAKFEADLQPLQFALNDANEARGVAKARLSNPQADASSVERLEQQRAIAQDAHARYDEARESETSASRALEQAKGAFVEAERRLGTLRGDVERKKQALATHLSYASPDESSVLYLLRSERPDWTQDIAKVLREDILERTDLMPIIGAIQDSVYGLQIDLDLLDTPLIADEVALQSQIDEIRAAIQESQGRIEQQEALLAQRSSERALADGILDRRKAETATAKVALDSARQREKSALAEVERSRNAAKELAQAAYNEADQAVIAAAQAMTRHRDRVDQELKTLRARQDERRKEIQRTLEQALASIGEKAAEAVNRFNDACVDLERDRSARLREQGVDTDALSELEQKLAEAERNLTAIQKSRNLIAQWRNWLASHWSRKPVLEETLARVLREKVVQEEASAALTKAFFEDRTRHEGIIKALTKKVGEIRDQRSGLERHRKGLETYAVDSNNLPPYDEAWTLVALVGQSTEQLHAVKIHENRLREHVDVLKRKFYANSGSPPEQYYSLQRQIMGPDRAEKSREWVPHFKAWYATEHEQCRNLLRVDARTIADAVGDFRDRMDAFHRKVLQFNRELQENLNSNLAFESIGSLSVEIASSIRELEYWDTIDKVAESRREWLTGEPVDLPPPAFASSLKELLQHWQLKEGIQAELTNLVRIQGEVVENGNRRQFRKAEDLDTVSSNGLSYIVMVLIFVGFINRVRGKASVNVVWALDEIKDLDIGNIELLMEILGRNNITLVSACPDPDPDVLALFRNRRSIRSDRCIYDPSAAKRADEVSDAVAALTDEATLENDDV
ncbi:ATP-binding protein [Burkholderia contaminans]|uniref:ATP-binding protein n=1 Tax=Burkholderia contaminans TaxID=488447 RepID=UPI00158B9A03|nr:ATP-binding protein [Burkholderia contaminans]MCA7885971.1 ATP-binding protein [Burkholderia contaminans]HEM7878658.1 ATP-binding protein [Burkholderia contaminans]